MRRQADALDFLHEELALAQPSLLLSRHGKLAIVFRLGLGDSRDILAE